MSTSIDRLTSGDIANLSVEDQGRRPFHIGAFLTFAPDAFPMGFSLTAMRDAIKCRLNDVPRLRRIVQQPPFGLGRPYWLDAPSFDITEHVRECSVANSTDEASLLRVVEELNEGLMDRGRPLWELWFLTGSRDGRIAAFFKVHHVVADGIAGVALLMSLLDLAPDSVRYSSEWTACMGPSRTDLALDQLRAIRVRAMRMFHPVRAIRGALSALPALREGFAGEAAPRLSFNRPIGLRRRLGFVRASLEDVRTAAHAAGGTINDVLLTAAGDGVRVLLDERGERTHGDPVRVSVPVALPRPDGTGNRTSIMVVPVDIGDADPVRRLERVVAETTERKRKPRPELMSGILSSALAQRVFARYAEHQRSVNLFVTNVPGPTVPLYLAGARVDEIFPVVPLGGNVSVSVAVLSYAGKLYVTVVADRDVVPDAEAFTRGLESSVGEFVRRLGPRVSVA